MRPYSARPSESRYDLEEVWWARAECFLTSADQHLAVGREGDARYRVQVSSKNLHWSRDNLVSKRRCLMFDGLVDGGLVLCEWKLPDVKLLF